MMNTDDGYYTITFGCGTGLIPDGEVESDFVDTYRGQVLFHHEDSDEEEIAGDFYATVVRTGDAHDAGISTYDLWEAHSQELYEYYEVLFDRRTGEFKRSIQRRFEPMGENVLILNEITILPLHRGQKLGLAVASRLMDVLGKGCDLAVCLPSPLQFGPLKDEEKGKKLSLEDFDANRDRAFRHLRNHWQKLGFQRLSRNQDQCPFRHFARHYALALHCVRPNIKELK